MRIFISCLQSLRDHPVTHYKHWERHFKRGIEEAGHQWVEGPSLDWVAGCTIADPDQQSSWRGEVWERAVQFIKEEHAARPIDLFLSYLFPKQIEAGAMTEIRRLGIPCVNFFCDNVREFAAIPNEYRAFDLHWVPEIKALSMYARAGLPTVFAPMPCWVDPKHRRWQHEERYGITFIGSSDELRRRLFAEVAQLGVRVEVRGLGWLDYGGQLTDPVWNRGLWQTLQNQRDFIAAQGVRAWGRKAWSRTRRKPSYALSCAWLGAPLGGEAYIEVTQGSMVTLGVNRYASFRRPAKRPDTYSRLRDVEAPMMGACYLTEWTDGLDRLYELGKEIETYKTAHELADKGRDLTNDAKKRKALRRGGQRRALMDHTVAKSLEKISAALGLPPVRSRQETRAAAARFQLENW
jgi:hypothetical protein